MQPRKEGFIKDQVSDFADSIINNWQPNASGEQGLLAPRVIDAMYNSYKTRKEVSL